MFSHHRLLLLKSKIGFDQQNSELATALFAVLQLFFLEFLAFPVSVKNKWMMDVDAKISLIPDCVQSSLV